VSQHGLLPEKALYPFCTLEQAHNVEVVTTVLRVLLVVGANDASALQVRLRDVRDREGVPPALTLPSFRNCSPPSSSRAPSPSSRS
jgi:hypothetical protein